MDIKIMNKTITSSTIELIRAIVVVVLGFFAIWFLDDIKYKFLGMLIILIEYMQMFTNGNLPIKYSKSKHHSKRRTN